MVDKLTKLLNTLMIIETKGENTKTMSDCLRYLENLIQDEKNKAAEKPDNVNGENPEP